MARGCFYKCAGFAYVLKASDGKTEPEAESKTKAVGSKRAIESAHFNVSPVVSTLWGFHD